MKYSDQEYEFLEREIEKERKAHEATRAELQREKDRRVEVRRSNQDLNEVVHALTKDVQAAEQRLAKLRALLYREFGITVECMRELLATRGLAIVPAADVLPAEEQRMADAGRRL